MLDLEIIAPTYNNGHLLKAFIESFFSQTNQNWFMHLIHDGPPSEDYLEVCERYQDSTKINFNYTFKRYNDWGHSLRAIGIRDLGCSKYTLITNGDNYYIPTFINNMVVWEEDLIFCDMIHNHDWRKMGRVGYKFFETKLAATFIDCGCVIVKTDIVKKIGWPHRNFSADWGFISEVLKLNPTSRKVDKILFVHN